jgi:hypothetical protein
MQVSHNKVLAAQEAARASLDRSVRPPREALPRRLQACMQELLSVNERYHELLQVVDTQRRELEAARAEIAQLRPALSEAEAKCAANEEARERAETAAQDLRATHELQVARCTAAEAERDDLHKVVRAYAERLLASEKRTEETQQHAAESEAWLASHWQAGFEEGVAQQRNEARSKLRRAQQQAQQSVAEAFDKGKQQASDESSSRLLREQAERRLLLHRAEEARVQQRKLAKALEDERMARERAQERSAALQGRLRSVRHEKESIAGELSVTRAAHVADLKHFDQMEDALGLACAEYSSLAVRHARAVSPPTVSAAPDAEDPRFGCSPPEAMRTRPPRPAAISDSEPPQPAR